jgi:hypothetical protein
MNWYPIIALVAFLYAALTLYIIIKKPPSMMKLGKVEMMQRLIGNSGTEILYYVVSLVAIGIGIWALMQ